MIVMNQYGGIHPPGRDNGTPVSGKPVKTALRVVARVVRHAPDRRGKRGQPLVVGIRLGDGDGRAGREGRSFQVLFTW